MAWHALETRILAGGSLLHLASPFRFQFGIPGLQADFSANLGGVSNFGSTLSNLAIFGGGSSKSGSSSTSGGGATTPSRGSWPWSQVGANGANGANSWRQPEETLATVPTSDAGLQTSVANKSAVMDGAGGFGLWDSYGIAVRGGAGNVVGVSPEDGIVFNLFTR